MICIGIDPSSKKVACILTVDDGPPVAWTVSMKSEDYVVRCAEAFGSVLNWIEDVAQKHRGHSIHAFIEDPVVGRGGAYSTIVQSKVHGAIVAALAVSGKCASIKSVNNSHWKKKIVGKGNAGKPEIKAWAKQFWRQLFSVANGGKDQDLIDAGGINRYGHGVIEVMRRLERHRRGEIRKRPLKRRRLR